MQNQNSLKVLIAINVFAILICLAPTGAYAQTKEQDRQKAMALFDANNFVAALPLLEKLTKDYPNDPAIESRLGFVLFALGATEVDQKVRHEYWQRARQILKQSQAHGDDSNLTRLTLEGLSQDNSAPTISFSDKKAAEEEMRKGEALFVRGEIEKALVAYRRALELDPQLYEAALYAGDMEFRLAFDSKDDRYRHEHFAQADVWFTKAIAIDPNRETAYRYWGDALDQEGKTEAARDKFVEAIIAEPYSGDRAYVGLTQWGDRHKVELRHPKINIPSDLVSKKPGEINITLDQSVFKEDDGSAAWMMYGIVRASWMDKKDGSRSEKFAKAHPKETSYRHTLAEEMDALRGVLESVAVQKKEKTVKSLSPDLEKLLRLHEAGLLEAYILFAKADAGIVHDYEAYRRANREKLKQYWLSFVVAAR
jgi:tetratricopeptide (TPR) repeat protein